MTVATVNGRIEGFFCVAPLTETGLRNIGEDCITTIRGLRDTDLEVQPHKASGFFFEVIATAPWSRLKTGTKLLFAVVEFMQDHSDKSWFACPITNQGVNISLKAWF